MTAILAAIAFVAGFVAGLFVVTGRLKRRAAVLDAERDELHGEWAQLHKAQRDHYDELVQWVAEKESRVASWRPKQSRWMT